MNHASIRDRQLPERYVMGRLTGEERLEFEEHFLDCPACIEVLESLEGLRAGLRELSRSRTPAVRRRSARGAILGPRWGVLLAAACLVLAIAPLALLRREPRQPTGGLGSASRSAPEAPTREREPSVLAGDAGAAAPFGVAVATLNLTRGAGVEAPANRITLGGAGEWAIFLLDRPATSAFESFRARIATADGRRIADALAASAIWGGSLAVAVPPGLLHDGDFLVTVEGVSARLVRDLATYRLRAALRTDATR